MSAHVMTTLGQLQQLSDVQLSIMCHNYQITPGYITPQNRRHLERKLHVAIIEESAKNRAFDYIAREKDEEYQQDLYARGKGLNMLSPRPRTYCHSSELYDARRPHNVGTMTTPSVHNIVGNRTLWPSPLPSTTPRSYAPRRAPRNTSIIPDFVKNIAKELPLMIWKGLEKQLSPFQRFRGGEQRDISIGEQPSTSQNAQDMPDEFGADQSPYPYGEQGETYPYGLDYEELKRYTNQTTYSDVDGDVDDDVSFVSTERPVYDDSFTSIVSSFRENIEKKSTVVKTPPKAHPLQSLFNLVWWRKLASNKESLPAGMELDHDSEREEELQSFEYLTEDQKQAEQNKEVRHIMGRIHLREDSDDEDNDMSLPSRQQRMARSCGAFCRYIYELLCCDQLGTWNAEKVRCTVFCCSMLAFACLSFRGLR